MLRRAVTNTPFVPFNILFTHAVQTLSVPDLTRIENFAASLYPKEKQFETTTHPRRVYGLLCKTARAYIESRSQSQHGAESMNGDMFDLFDFVNPDAFDLDNWYQGNQQILQLLESNSML